MKDAKGTSKNKTRLSFRRKGSSSKPQRFLLYMARKGATWAGRVTCVSDETEFRFRDLDELKDWLDAYGERPLESLSGDRSDNVEKKSK